MVDFVEMNHGSRGQQWRVTAYIFLKYKYDHMPSNTEIERYAFVGKVLRPLC